MSWSIPSITLSHKRTDIGLQKDLDALNALVASGNDDCPKERDEQVALATDAVFHMLANDHVFDNAEEVTVSLSGHASADHQQGDPAYSNEFLSIHISVKKYRQT